MLDISIPADLIDERPPDLSAFLPISFGASPLQAELPGFLVGVNGGYVDAFFADFQDNLLRSIGSQFYLDLFAIFLFFAGKLNAPQLLSHYERCWLSPVVFHRRFSVFGEQSPTIQAFRAHVWNAASPEIWLRILEYTASKSPYLFAEQVLRILPNLGRFEGELFASDGFLSILMSIAGYLQADYVKDCSNNGCVIARIACLSLIFAVIDDPVTCSIA
jgi:hypothetical protein